MNKLLRKLKEHDPDTYYHCTRVADLSLAIAKTMDFSKKEQEIVYYGGLLHDIGKLKISKDVLTKPAKLSFEEWGQIQKHPVYGFEILNAHRSIPMDIKYIILLHHERLNGSGYPFGLSGEDIDLKTQIVAIADSFDAMTSLRAYSKAKLREEALDLLQADKGTLYLPIIVDKLVEVLNRNMLDNREWLQA